MHHAITTMVKFTIVPLYFLADANSASVPAVVFACVPPTSHSQWRLMGGDGGAGSVGL